MAAFVISEVHNSCIILLSYDTQAFTTLGQGTFKPSCEFVGAIQGILSVRIIEAKV